MNHLTRIVKFPGFNILGLLEFLSVIGGVPAELAIQEKVGVPFRGAIMLTVVVLVIALDLWWRGRQPETRRWQRLLSPFAGGCLLFVPVWLFFPMAAVIATIVIWLGKY